MKQDKKQVDCKPHIPRTKEWWPHGAMSQVALLARTALNTLSQILRRHNTPRFKTALRLEAASKQVLGPSGAVPLEAWLTNVFTPHPAFATLTEKQRLALRAEQDEAERSVGIIFKNLVAIELTAEEQRLIKNAAERLRHRISGHKTRYVKNHDAIIASQEENEEE